MKKNKLNKAPSDFLEYYDTEIVKMIIEKYDIPQMEAFKKFINSKTYAMLENKDFAMWEFGYPGIFDIWENEQVTGTPHTSVYLRSID